MAEYPYEIIIITVRHDRRLTFDKAELKTRLEALGCEIIRVERVKRW